MNKIQILRKRADKIVSKVQKEIKENGAYENAGIDEVRQFQDNLSEENLQYKEFSDLMDYINYKIDNLQY